MNNISPRHERNRQQKKKKSKTWFRTHPHRNMLGKRLWRGWATRIVEAKHKGRLLLKEEEYGDVWTAPGNKL